MKGLTTDLRLPLSLSFHKGIKQSPQANPLSATQKTQADILPALMETLHRNESTVREFQSSAGTLAETGITDAANDQPAVNSTSSAAEEAIIHAQAEAEASVTHSFWETETLFQNALSTQKAKMSTLPTKEDCEHELEQKKHQEITKAERQVKLPAFDLKLWWLIWLKRTINGALSALKEQLRLRQEQWHNADTHYQNLLEEYHQILPEKGLIDHTRLFLGILFGFTVMEVGVNFSAFKDQGMGNIYICFVVGVVFAVGQTFFADSLGLAWQKKDRVKFWIYLPCTLACCLLLVISRLWMNDVDLIERFGYSIVNLFFALLTVLLAHARARHHTFFCIQTKRDRLSRQIKHIGSSISQIEESHRKRCKEIDLEIESQAAKMAKSARQELEESIAGTEAGLVQMEGHRRNMLYKVKSIGQNALNRYRQLNQDTRLRTGRPLVARWQHLLFWVALAFICQSCSTSLHAPPLPETHMEVFYDRTDTIDNEDVVGMEEYICSFVFPDSFHGQWSKTEITLSAIGETSTQPIQTIHLPASEPYDSWEYNERKLRKSKKDFRQKLRAALTALTKPGTGMDYSFIQRNFVERLTPLSRQKGRRIVLCWSDLIINDRNVNFYNYKEHPERLWQDRDALIARMTRDYPLPQMTGVTLVNIHLPSKANDSLHDVSKRLFHYYWTGLGMEVEFKANLPILPKVTANE